MLSEIADPASNGDCGGKWRVFGHAAMVKHSFAESKHYLLQASRLRCDHQAMLDANEIRLRFQRALKSNPGLALKTIAEECDVTPQAVGDWKRTGRIDKKHFQKLGALMHTGLDYWLADKPETVVQITGLASRSSAGMAELLTELTEAQTAMARVLAVSIPTVGHALVARLEKLDPLSERDYVTALKGILQRDLASQDVAGLQSSSRKARGSGPRKHR